MSPAEAPRRKKLPSQSVTISTLGGGSVATVAMWILGMFGIVVPPEVAAPLGSVLGGVLGYFLNGGRKS